MRIISYNVNGLRSILSKNTLEDIISTYDPDIVGLQETRCPDNYPVNDLITKKYPYFKIVSSKTKKGYSGVAIFSKEKPIQIYTDFPQNEEGRMLVFEYDKFCLINAYVPNSKEDLSRLTYRIQEWEPAVRRYVAELQAKTRKPSVFCADFNVAHTELDIYTTKGKEKKHGFTKEEREAFSELLKHNNFIDSFRYKNPTLQKFSWFSNFHNSRDKNNGWRIDTILVSSSLKDKIKEADIINCKGSDHNPVYCDIKFDAH